MANILSDAELVRNFTKESGIDVPDKPELMSKEEVFFLVKMMLDEIMEMCATVSESYEAKINMIKMITDSKNIPLSNVEFYLKNEKTQKTFEDTFRKIGQLGEAEDYTYCMNEFQNYVKYKVIGEQGDALVDSYYYSLNAAAKKGINLSKIFYLVHKANMDKRDPITKKFIKREDGKIIKPIGWKEPNITEEIERQTKEHSF